MANTISKAALLRQLQAHFPDRWEVARLETRFEGQKVSGIIKIRCQQDDKTFLSDYSGKLDEEGHLVDLTLDGVHVGKFVGRLHQ